MALRTRVWHERTPSARVADRADQPQMVLQPVVDLASGAPVGAEALARFTDWGLPVAERFALAHAAGHGAELEAACLTAALARRPELPAGTWLSVNVSPDALAHPAIGQALAGDLTGVVVEITEVAASDREMVRRAVTELRQRGALLAVDDASTGYAGLLRLSRLRPDIVKLDAGLVTGAADSVEQSAVIEALVSLSRRIGARVLGEGVETLDDLRALIDLDVDYAQGWVLARPANQLAPIAPAAAASCRAERQRMLHRHAAPPDALPDVHQDLHRVTAALAGSIDAAELNTSLLRAATSLGVDLIGLSILTGGVLREIASADTAPDQNSYPLARYPATRDALSSGRMVEIQLDDPAGDPAERALLRARGFASLLIVPLIRNGTPLGILEFSHHTPRRWSGHDIRQAHTLADHVTHALLRLNTGTPHQHADTLAGPRRPAPPPAAKVGRPGPVPVETVHSTHPPTVAQAGAMAAAFAHSPTATGVCDEDGRLVQINNSLARLLQRPASDILGRPFLAFVHPDERAASLACYFNAVVNAAATRHDAEPEPCQLRCLTGTDTVLHTSVTWTVTAPDASGHQYGVVHVVNTTPR